MYIYVSIGGSADSFDRFNGYFNMDKTSLRSDFSISWCYKHYRTLNQFKNRYTIKTGMFWTEIFLSQPD